MPVTMKEKRELERVKVSYLFQLVVDKIKNGEDCLKENELMYGMILKDVKLGKMGVIFQVKHWQGNITKEFFPFISQFDSTASQILKMLTKKLY